MNHLQDTLSVKEHHWKLFNWTIYFFKSLNSFLQQEEFLCWDSPLSVFEETDMRERNLCFFMKILQEVVILGKLLDFLSELCDFWCDCWWHKIVLFLEVSFEPRFNLLFWNKSGFGVDWHLIVNHDPLTNVDHIFLKHFDFLLIIMLFLFSIFFAGDLQFLWWSCNHMWKSYELERTFQSFQFWQKELSWNS